MMPELVVVISPAEVVMVATPAEVVIVASQNDGTGTKTVQAATIVNASYRCVCRKSNADILVVQPAENWAAKNLPGPYHCQVLAPS